MRRVHFITYFVAALIFPGCGGGDLSGPPEAPLWRTCPISTYNWPGGSVDLHTDDPKGCPLTLQHECQYVKYSGIISWPNSGYVVYNLTDFYYTDGNFNVQGGTYTPTWSNPVTTPTVQITGEYRAALAGFQVSNNADALHFRFQRVDNSTITSAGLVAAYGFGNPVRITFPESVDPYTSFRVNADLLDAEFIPPVTYTWSEGGNPLGYTADYFDFPGSDPGVERFFELTISDSEGRSHYRAFSVRTRLCTWPCNES